MIRITAVCLVGLFMIGSACETKHENSSQSDLFLDSLSHQTFNYFWDLADSGNAQIPDRWPSQSFSSIAATGFGLTSYLVGAERGYVTREQAAERVLKTLLFFYNSPKGDSATG